MNTTNDQDASAIRELKSDEIDAVTGGAIVRMVSLSVAGLNVETFYDTEKHVIYGVAGGGGEVMAVTYKPV